MAILQAPPTSQPVTHRAAALARGDGAARGGAYRERAFKSAWSRLMHEALDDSAGPPILLAGQRFHFHDLRAFFVTEHKRQRNRLPDIHPDSGTTARIYERSKLARRKSL